VAFICNPEGADSRPRQARRNTGGRGHVGREQADGVSSHTDETNSAALSILCLPARTEADEITALMLAQLLESRHRLVEAVSVTTLAGEMVDMVEQRKPDVVCISATPPAAVMHAGHLCRHVRARFPKERLVVGLWDAQGDLTKIKQRIGCGAIVVATLAEAQEQVRLLIQSLLPGSEEQTQTDGGLRVLAEAQR
jgi:hypothetical protein